VERAEEFEINYSQKFFITTSILHSSESEKVKGFSGENC
jgi:hypothetical protein